MREWALKTNWEALTTLPRRSAGQEGLEDGLWGSGGNSRCDPGGLRPAALLCVEQVSRAFWPVSLSVQWKGWQMPTGVRVDEVQATRQSGTRSGAGPHHLPWWGWAVTASGSPVQQQHPPERWNRTWLMGNTQENSRCYYWVWHPVNRRTRATLEKGAEPAITSLNWHYCGSGTVSSDLTCASPSRNWKGCAVTFHVTHGNTRV